MSVGEPICAVRPGGDNNPRCPSKITHNEFQGMAPLI